MSRQQLFSAFFFAVFLFLLVQVYALFSLFLVPLIWAVIFVLTFYPLFTLLLTWCQGRRNLSSLLMTVLVVLLVAVPVFLFTSVLTSEALALYQRTLEATQSGELQQFLASWRETYLGQLWQKWGPQIAAFDIDVPGLALQGANAASQFIAGQATGIARNLFVFLFDFLIMSFSLFFLFRDGEGLYITLRDLIPMEPEHKDQVFQRFYETVSAVVQGVVATAVAQGALVGLAFWGLGVPFSLFFAFAAALASFQPIGGAAVIWLPCVFYLGLAGSWGKALILLGYGVLAISGADNILKPLIIGGRTKLPTIFLFFGMLGGLEAYGFLGIFLGPVVLATIVAFVNIYREEYTHQVAEL
ncbi:MAG: AI-2E family transporter [Deltaproteobacteria bacterium]|nr:AI-2E family transporter [Deltaproteobacteria bacterium]